MHYIIKFDSLKIQSFLACLCFIEKHRYSSTFELEDASVEIENRLLQIFPGLTFKKRGDGRRIIIQTDHSLPETQIGDRKSRLFFPKLISRHVATLKSDKIFFCGLITLKRFKYIFRSVYAVDRYECLKLLRLLVTNKVETTNFYIIHSKGGRVAETKYWDENYYDILGGHRFVLCPPGDFDWTYRYYETILLGSIPVSLLYNKNAYPYGVLLIKDLLKSKEDFNLLVDFESCKIETCL